MDSFEKDKLISGDFALENRDRNSLYMILYSVV